MATRFGKKMRERQEAQWRGPGYRGTAARPFEIVGVFIGAAIILGGLIFAIWAFRDVFGDKLLRVGEFREQLAEVDGQCVWTVEVDLRTDVAPAPRLEGLSVEVERNDGFAGQRTVELPGVAVGTVSTAAVETYFSVCPSSVEGIEHGPLVIRYQDDQSNQTRFRRSSF